ncbi:DUF4080 domain-containing protein [Hydrogeniiclostridium mannosilyticum]|uniref:B12-binding domain-containing radical SAM protein n=1 Tax=Hydrogeniiclostridium mannosilyticum TaxID=2764322 RepID=UPI00399BFC45
MKILLTAINAKYIHTNLALRSIRAYIGQYGFSATLSEYTINQPFDDILASIYLQAPDVVAFSCYLWNISLVRRLCVELKKLLPSLHIWLGGPEVSYNSGSFLRENPAVDLVLIGEGEETFRQLLSSLNEGGNPTDVPGIAYRASGAIYQTNPAKPMDLAALPFAYEDLSAVKNKILYFETSRGCPFHCSYCLSALTPGVRFVPLAQACSFLRRFLQAGVRQVKFVDRTFNCNPAHADGILSYLIQNDNGVTNFHFEIAADILADSTIALIQSARKELFQFEVGIQSTCAQTLEAIHRSCNNRLVFQKVGQLLAPGNAHIHVDLIAGLPLEDYQRFARSYDEVFALKADMLQLGFLKVLKGSAMEMEGKRYGIVAQEQAPYEVLQTDVLSYSDLLRLKQIEVLNERLHNSGRFRASLSYLLNKTASPFHFLEGFAAELSRLDRWGNAWGKYDLHCYLYEYAQILWPGEHDLIWYMRHDLFSRENAKGIPPLLNQSLYVYYRASIEAYRRDEKGHSSVSKKNSHIEIYPFSPITGEKGLCALLYQYGDSSVEMDNITEQLFPEQAPAAQQKSL